MAKDVVSMGSRVRVVNDSPLKGLQGTIIAINMIATPGKPTLCFYKIVLDGMQPQEPMLFECHEVELVGASCEELSEC